jgi:hypothetical protein
MPVLSIPSVVRDLEGVLLFLQRTNLVPKSPAKELVISIRRLHRATYSLILWRFRLGGVPPHGSPFIEEIASDALQILPHALAGYRKTTHLLIRGIIENSLRYLYYCDHPVEFQKMNSPKKWYLEPKELFEYAFSHPRLTSAESKFHAIGDLKNLYSELSGAIHGGRVTDLEMRIALNKIVFEQKALDQHVAFVEQCAEAVNFTLSAFHIDRFRGFRAEDRRIILRSISASGRNVLSNL